jgi:hypothetical protein
MVSVISAVVKARTGTKHTDANPAPTESWETAMREESRREQQRKRMVKWRQTKKVKVADMMQERRRLEKQLQRQVHKARVESDRLTVNSTKDVYLQTTI